MLGVCLGVGWGFAGEVKMVEPEVRADFEAAVGKLPERLRQRVADVELVRKEDLGLGGEVSLEYRLLNRAAYASFSVLERTLTVYDAGVTNRPEWKGGAPEAGEVARMLAGVADVLEVKAPSGPDDPALAVAWEAFVKRVYSWGEEEVPKVIPPPGDPKVLNSFLQEGVWRLMGGEVGRIPMLVHEFGHALQLEPELDSLSARMGYWGRISGFVQASSGKAADGFSGGRNKTENAIVLIRLLLAGDPAKLNRGPDADYGTSDDARFVNRYARFDLREDYAESFRLMAYEPQKLAKIAPEKFLYLNALGWNAALDLKEPGPLWYSGAELARLIPEAKRKAVFSRLFGRDGRELGLEVEPLTAILRAHEGELSSRDLPKPFPILEVPDDLPEVLRKALDTSLLEVKIEGAIYAGDEASQRKRQDEVIKRWIDRIEFELGIVKLLVNGTGGVGGAYEDLNDSKTLQQREHRYEAIREAAKSELTEEELRGLDLKEMKFHREAGNQVAAKRYELLSSNKDLAELLKVVDLEAKKVDTEYDRVRLLGTGVDLALRSGNAEVIRERIKGVPGETLGRWMRVRFMMQAAGGVDSQAEKAKFKKAAEEEWAACEFPELKNQLRLIIEE